MFSMLNKKRGDEKGMFKILVNKFSTQLGTRRLKITDVARATGISRTTLTNLYYDRNTTISLETLDKLCNYFNCNVNDLFEYRKEE